jgi:hypothetical protein
MGYGAYMGYGAHMGRKEDTEGRKTGKKILKEGRQEVGTNEGRY